MPQIPGVTIPQEKTQENKKENDRQYLESQEQRALERDVREAKRKAAAYDAAGLDEAFTEQALKVKQKQAAYNQFCKQTGRAKRLDRTQVVGYSKNISNKVNVAVKQREKLVNSLRNSPVRLPDGSFSKITKGAAISDLETFAGKNAKTELRVKNFLAVNYGRRAEEWRHSKARSYIDTPEGPKKAIIHWFYEESIGAKEVFVKGWSKK